MANHLVSHRDRPLDVAAGGEGQDLGWDLVGASLRVRWFLKGLRAGCGPPAAEAVSPSLGRWGRPSLQPLESNKWHSPFMTTLPVLVELRKLITFQGDNRSPRLAWLGLHSSSGPESDWNKTEHFSHFLASHSVPISSPEDIEHKVKILWKSFSTSRHSFINQTVGWGLPAGLCNSVKLPSPVLIKWTKIVFKWR